MADNLPQAALVHVMEGRTRLRVADRRGEAGFFASLATGLSAIEGIRKVEVSPLTGGILILHDVPLSQISEAAEKAGLFALIGPAIERDSSEQFTLRITPQMAAAAALGLVAAWQIYKEKVFPPALTAAWYAASLAGLLSVDDRLNKEG